LLAKAVDQSPDMLTDPAFSRASPLPHFDQVHSFYCLQGERQRCGDLLALRQALLELGRVVNQYVLAGKGFSRDQP